ncbi:hypothetical protein AB0F81_21825 [Actinoplanes sp. NPDC024001]|uniref:hypothetical protein n=1 Tax=Actinoplanes sp. NPDC024001 TaxID=3154598 RepID=UPI0033EE17D4
MPQYETAPPPVRRNVLILLIILFLALLLLLAFCLANTDSNDYGNGPPPSSRPVVSLSSRVPGPVVDSPPSPPIPPPSSTSPSALPSSSSPTASPSPSPKPEPSPSSPMPNGPPDAGGGSTAPDGFLRFIGVALMLSALIPAWYSRRSRSARA